MILIFLFKVGSATEDYPVPVMNAMQDIPLGRDIFMYSFLLEDDTQTWGTYFGGALDDRGFTSMFLEQQDKIVFLGAVNRIYFFKIPFLYS